MATLRQTVEILDDAFSVAGTGRLHADSLRAAGLIPKSQGKPAPIASQHVALLLMSVLLGEPSSQDHPDRVQSYAALRPGEGGPTLGQVLSSFVDSPHDLFTFTLDLSSLSASVTLRQANRGMATIIFSSDESRVSAIERTATMTGGTLTSISAAIANAPEVKTGRRRRHRSHK